MEKNSWHTWCNKPFQNCQFMMHCGQNLADQQKIKTRRLLVHSMWWTLPFQQKCIWVLKTDPHSFIISLHLYMTNVTNELRSNNLQNLKEFFCWSGEVHRITNPHKPPGVYLLAIGEILPTMHHKLTTAKRLIYYNYPYVYHWNKIRAWLCISFNRKQRFSLLPQSFPVPIKQCWETW